MLVCGYAARAMVGRHAHEEVFRKWVRGGGPAACSKDGAGGGLASLGGPKACAALFWRHLRVVGGMWEAFFRDSV